MQQLIKDYVATCHQENLRMSGSLFVIQDLETEFILEKIKMKHLFKALLNQIHYETEEKLGIGVKG